MNGPLSRTNLLERSDFGGRHFETVSAVRPYLCDVIPSDRKFAGREKTATDMVSEVYFSTRLSTSLSSMLSMLGSK